MIATRLTNESAGTPMKLSEALAEVKATPLEINYTLTRDDTASAFDECMKMHTTKTAKAKLPPRQMAIVYALVILCALPIFLPFANTPLWPLAAMFGFSFSVAFLFVFGSLAAWMRTKAARRTFIAQAGGWENWVSESFAGINSDGLYKHSSRSMHTFFWHNIEDIVLSEKNVIFFLNPNTLPNMLFIPRRAFASDSEATAFVDTARAFKRQALQPEAVTP